MDELTIELQEALTYYISRNPDGYIRTDTDDEIAYCARYSGVSAEELKSLVALRIKGLQRMGVYDFVPLDRSKLALVFRPINIEGAEPFVLYPPTLELIQDTVMIDATLDSNALLAGRRGIRFFFKRLVLEGNYELDLFHPKQEERKSYSGYLREYGPRAYSLFSPLNIKYEFIVDR